MKELQTILAGVALLGLILLGGYGLGTIAETLFLGRDKVCVRQEPYVETIYDRKGIGYEFIKHQCVAWRIPYERYNEISQSPSRETVTESPTK